MFTFLNTASGSYSESRLKQKLQNLPKPRLARMDVRGQISSVLQLLFIGLWAILVGRVILNDWKASLVSAVVWLGILIVFVSMWLRELHREFRNRSLLKQGKCALGRVTSQMEAGRRKKFSEITYTFTDDIGQTWYGKGIDRTKSYVLDMPITIFYGSSNPAENVAACATVWKLRGLDGETVDLD